MKQLAGLPGLRHGVGDVQPGHVLVRHFRIDPHQLGMIERGDEAQIGAGRRHVDVAAGLVRFRLECEAIVVPAGDRVVAQVVHRLPQTLHRHVRPPAAVGLGPLASAPHHEDLRAELGAEIHRGHRLLDRQRTHRRIVGGERAVLEGGVREQVRRRHRHHEPVVQTRLPEVAHDSVPIGRRRVDGHQVVVMQVDSPGADVTEQPGKLDRGQPRPHRGAEGIASRVADRPETKGELVLGSRFVGVVGHGVPLRSVACGRPYRCSAP